MNINPYAKNLILLFLLGLAVGFFFLVNKPEKQVESQASGAETEEVPKIEPPAMTEIFFAGDIMLSRNVADRMAKANNFNLPYELVAEVIQKADIAFANLESPFNDTGRHFIEGSLIFNADPKSVEGLSFAGFDILSTANNHALDQGQKGLDLTLDLLEQNNIIASGTTSSTKPSVLSVINKNEILYGFLSYSYTALNDGGKTKDPHVNDLDTEKMEQDVLDMKGHSADVVIVNMHAGVEYTRTPNEDQVNFAHAAIDAGADLVVGHHPHWVQTVEQYKDKWIFYSLGNFVFDQMWSQDTKEGLTLLVNFEKEQIKKIELKPVIIENFCCPRWANEEETKSILSKINPVTNTAVIFENGQTSDDWKDATTRQ